MLNKINKTFQSQFTPHLYKDLYLTVEDRGWVVEKGVGSEEEQVGAVAPRHGVEDQLPRALRHLGSIFGQQPAPPCKRLQGQSRGKRQSVRGSHTKYVFNSFFRHVAGRPLDTITD